MLLVVNIPLQIIRKCLEDLGYLRSLSPSLRKEILEVFISSIESVFGGS